MPNTNRSHPPKTPSPHDRTETGYHPLPSVWEGSDAALLDLMIPFYCHGESQRILDVTVNRRQFWKGSERKYIGLDINPACHPDLVADHLHLPILSESVDVVIYDPPHVPNQGQDQTKDFQDRFGLRLAAPAGSGSLSHLFAPFVAEAYRVLRPDGILFAKNADYVHYHRYQWAHIDLVLAARETGFCPCDLIVKVRKSSVIDPRWKKAHHARRRHCYWLIFRKSLKCE